MGFSIEDPNLKPSHAWPKWRRELPYDAALPLLGSKDGEKPKPFTVVGGYMKVMQYDQGTIGPQTAYEMVIPLGIAIRLAYEQCWVMEANLIGNWWDVLVEAIRKALLSVISNIVLAVIAGGSISDELEKIAISLFEELKAKELLKTQIEGHFTALILHLHENCLLHYGQDYNERFVAKALFKGKAP
jgi:hypothetical protein